MKKIIVICLLILVSGCAVTKYNPKTGEVERSRLFADSDIQGFLAETPDGTHVEFESARSDTSETVKALIQFGIELGKAMR